MGYSMSQKDSAFIVKRENQEEMLERLKELCCQDVDLKWINNEAVVNANTLSEAMQLCLYNLIYDNKENVIDIQYTEENGKIGSEKLIFDTIAPCVTNGSFIKMIGEDGMEWEWEFRRNKCYENIITL